MDTRLRQRSYAARTSTESPTPPADDPAPSKSAWKRIRGTPGAPSRLEVYIAIAMVVGFVIGFAAAEIRHVYIDKPPPSIDSLSSIDLSRRTTTLCIGDGDCSSVAPDVLEQSPVVLTGNASITYSPSGIRMAQNERTGDVTLDVDNERLLTYLFARSVTVIGNGLLTDVFPLGASSVPEGALVLVGRPVDETVGGVWKLYREIVLSPSESMFFVYHVDRPDVRGLGFTTPDRRSFLFHPTTSTVPIMVGFPTAEQIDDYSTVRFLVAGSVTFQNVTVVDSLSCINNDPAPFFTGTRTLGIRTFQNGLTPGVNGGLSDAAFFPLASNTCYRASHYRSTLRPILIEATRNVAASGDVAALFDAGATTPMYFAVDSSACVSATEASIPDTVTFRFYASSACTGTLSVAYTVNVRGCAWGDVSQLVCTTLPA